MFKRRLAIIPVFVALAMATVGQQESAAVRLARVRALAESGVARRIRVGACLSLADVAADVGVTLGALSLWERGLRKPTGTPALRYDALLQELIGGGR